MLTPHDHLFKLIFGDPVELPALLTDLLSPGITDRLDLNAATPAPTEAVADDLSALHPDLRFEIPWREGGWLTLTLILEHQSSPDPQMPLRALRYTLQAWEAAARSEQRLPVVLTLVIFHGPRPWTTPKRLSEMFDAPREALPALAKLMPELSLNLVDLTNTPDDKIPGRDGGKLALLLLRDAHDKDLWGVLDAHLESLGVLNERRGIRPVRGVLRYITEVTEPALPSELRERIVRQVNPQLREELVSWAERLRAEGREQGVEIGVEIGIEQGIERGIEQGIEQGVEIGSRQNREKQARAVARALQHRFGPLPAWAEERIAAADVDALNLWIEGIFTADSLEGLLNSQP